jgi:hypothetical protein
VIGCVLVRLFFAVLNVRVSSPCNKVLEQVNGHNLLSDFQSGFRRGHYIAPLSSAKAERKVTVHVLLDFSKTFDLIDLGPFVHKLDS